MWHHCCFYKWQCKACCIALYPLYCSIRSGTRLWKFSFIPHSCWLPEIGFFQWTLHYLKYLSFCQNHESAWSVVLECYLFRTLVWNLKSTYKQYLQHLLLSFYPYGMQSSSVCGDSLTGESVKREKYNFFKSKNVNIVCHFVCSHKHEFMALFKKGHLGI